MNFEFNKIAGAVLGTALGVMAVGIVADGIYAPPHNEKPGYVIAVAEPGAGGEEEPAAPEVLPIADRLQTASADQGADDVAKCKTCHTFEKGGPKKVGPNLWGVVGANFVHVADFDYSDAMRAKGAEGMTWTFENLDQFIENPKGFIPGTAMTYAGVKDPKERADIIAYLRTLSDSPVPLPPPTPAPTAEAPAAPAETPPAATETPPAATETPPSAEAPPTETPTAPETPPAAETPPAETPPPATEQSAEPPADAAPAGQSDGAQAPPVPAEAPAAPPAESGGASSGESTGAAPTPTQGEPPAEAASPDGAPEPEAPATEVPAQ